jgi:hypothetical protein
VRSCTSTAATTPSGHSDRGRQGATAHAAEVVDTITTDDAAFRVPTTIARHGHDLYAVNARFGTPPTPATDYDVVSVSR